MWLNPWGQVTLYNECLNDVNCVKLSLLYLHSMHICAFIYLYLFRNAITHSLCVVYVWILWWSRTLCSWEQMARWIALRNLVLEDAKTQCYDKIWHWGMSFYFNCMMFCICYFTLFYSAASLEFFCNSKVNMNLLPTWTLLCLENKSHFM